MFLVIQIKEVVFLPSVLFLLLTMISLVSCYFFLWTFLQKVIDTIDADPFIDKLSAQFKDDPIGNMDKKTLEQAQSFKWNIGNPTSFHEDVREEASPTVKIKGQSRLKVNTTV